MVERQLPKLHTTVRSRSPAPELKSPLDAGFCFIRWQTLAVVRHSKHFCFKERADISVEPVGHVAKLRDIGVQIEAKSGSCAT
jgi:hypothetical protein